MNFCVADRAVPVPRTRKIVGNLRRPGGFLPGYRANVAVALDTKLSHVAALEQLGIRRAVRVMTRGTAFDF